MQRSAVRPSLAFSAIVAAVAVPSVRAQEVFETAYGKHQLESFGHSVAAGPDVDGDGIADVVVGAWNNFNNHGGTVFLFSGATFKQIAYWNGAAGEYLGSCVCWCGDVDGDGIADLAASGDPYGAGEIVLFSPVLATPIRTITIGGTGALGTSLADAGDRNGDGIDDLLVGAPSTSTGAAYLVSCKDGSVLQKLGKPLAGDIMGASVASVGDADNDGVGDFAVGSPGADATLFDDNAGAVDLFSGANGSLLWRRLGNWSWHYDWYGHIVYDGDLLGRHLASCGDVDGDGRADVVASPLAQYYVDILSGYDGSDVRKLTTLTANGLAIAPIGDLDGDGLPEIAVADAPYLQIVSSRSGRWIWRSDDLGVPDGVTSISGISDVDGDGLPDFVLGLEEDATNAFGAGRAEVRTSNDLWLDVAPLHRPAKWMTLELRANEGPPGNLAALLLTGVNGVPAFQVLTVGVFDATESALLAQAFCPSGFTGTDLSLRAIAVGASGKLVQSADEHLILP